jgi:hypothetical protein
LLALDCALRHSRSVHSAAYYHRATNWLVGLAGQNDKLLHMYVGLTIWVVGAMIMRRPLRSWWPVCLVVVAEVANEILDRIATGSWNWADTAADTAATCSWPVILTLSLAALPKLRR